MLLLPAISTNMQKHILLTKTYKKTYHFFDWETNNMLEYLI